MTILYTYKGNHKVYKKASFIEKAMDFLERHEGVFNFIGIAIFLVFAYFFLAAYGK